MSSVNSLLNFVTFFKKNKIIACLQLTGSVLEDAWKEKGKKDMEEIIQRIENVVLDANCSR